MKVFLSWSGKRSRFVAEALRGWLPRVIQSLRPWMSDEDIAAGSRWLLDVSGQLADAKVGILCVTPENQGNPWLVFEAGALSKTLDQPFVCPLLFDLGPAQLTGPLAQFQALTLDRAGVLRVLQNLNNVLGHEALSQKDLEEIFEVWWPKLEQRLAEIPPIDQEEHIAKRGVEDLLEEVLGNTREQLRRENVRIEHSAVRDQRMDAFLPKFEQLVTFAEQYWVTRGKDLKGVLSAGATAPEFAAIAERMFGGVPPSMEAIVDDMKALSETNKAQLVDLLTPPQQG